MSLRRPFLQLSLGIFAIFNLSLTTWRVYSTLAVYLRTTALVKPLEYSYVGNDYPLEYPTSGELETVAMSLHESIHFSLEPSDQIAGLEWEVLVDNPKGYGRARLGQDHRVFSVTFYHQTHCLKLLHTALVERDEPTITPQHAQHCINYLRQTFLCEAADGLEKGDFIERDYEKDRLGDDLVCRDWETLYDGLDKNWRNWVEWRSRWN